MGSCLSIHINIENPHSSIPKAAKGHGFTEEIKQTCTRKPKKIKTIHQVEKADTSSYKNYSEDKKRALREYSKEHILSTFAVWIEEQPKEERKALQMYILSSAKDLGPGGSKPFVRKLYPSLCIEERIG